MENLDIPFERISSAEFFSVDMKPSAHLCTFECPALYAFVACHLPIGADIKSVKYFLYYTGTRFYVRLVASYVLEGIDFTATYFYRSA